MGGLISRALAAEKFEGKSGQISYLFTNGKLPAARVMVVGLGARGRRSAEAVRHAAAAAARRARDLGAAHRGACICPRRGCPRASRAQATVEGALLGTYRFDKYLKEKSGKVLAVAHRRGARGGASSAAARDGRAARRDRRGRHHASRATSSTSRPTW